MYRERAFAVVGVPRGCCSVVHVATCTLHMRSCTHTKGLWSTRTSTCLPIAHVHVYVHMRMHNYAASLRVNPDCAGRYGLYRASRSSDRPLPTRDLLSNQLVQCVVRYILLKRNASGESTIKRALLFADGTLDRRCRSNRGGHGAEGSREGGGGRRGVAPPHPPPPPPRGR